MNRSNDSGSKRTRSAAFRGAVGQRKMFTTPEGVPEFSLSLSNCGSLSAGPAMTGLNSQEEYHGDDLSAFYHLWAVTTLSRLNCELNTRHSTGMKAMAYVLFAIGFTFLIAGILINL